MPRPLKHRKIATPSPLSIAAHRLLMLECSDGEGQQQQAVQTSHTPTLTP